MNAKGLFSLRTINPLRILPLKTDKNGRICIKKKRATERKATVSKIYRGIHFTRAFGINRASEITNWSSPARCRNSDNELLSNSGLSIDANRDQSHLICLFVVTSQLWHLSSYSDLSFCQLLSVKNLKKFENLVWNQK